MRSFLIFLLCFAFQISSAQISEFIHVDQFGYETNSEKFAVLADPISGFNSGLSYTPGSTIELRKFQNDSLVFSASPTQWNGGGTHTQSGDRGWWFDFSSFTQAGTYYIIDPSNNEQSGPFQINANPYQSILTASTKMFYYNRCNSAKAAPYAAPGWTDGTSFTNALQDANCRYIYDAGNASLEKDLTGGWFDAGDYNKYVTFAFYAMHDLLTAYEDNAAVFGDDFNIPESGDGLSDLLNEIKWELDWIKKMTNSDGTVHIKMGSNSHTTNVGAPPSVNTDQRYYGPTCTTASIATASMFAHAALVFQNEPGMSTFANELEDIAEDCWAYFEPLYNSGNLEYDCDDGSIVAGDADWTNIEQTDAALIAAVYLFDLTGNSIYNNFIVNNYNINEPISTDWWGPYKLNLYEALLHYTTITGANTSVSSTITTSATNSVNNNWDGFYDVGTDDLYRAYGPDYIHHWGSNKPKANIGNLCMMMKKYNLSSGSNAALELKAAEQLKYFHGINPMGLVYLTNMYQYGGDRCADEIYHTWFNDGTDWDDAVNDLYGPAPGFLSGGPNKDFTGGMSPPAAQPILKSYLDFNDGYPEMSWEITEPSITYQSAYVRLLANFVNNNTVTSNTNIGAVNSCVEIFPNPTDQYFVVTGLLANYNIEVLDSNGNVHQTITAQGSEAVIDVSNLPAGMFFVKVENQNNVDVCVLKMIKEN